MKLLVTGHRGAIGRKLNEKLLALGHEVYGVDIKDGKDCADITNLGSFRGVQVIFHLAAHIEYPKKNTMDACDTMLHFAKENNAKIIYASSAAIYNPYSMYAVHKLYGERLFITNWKNTAALRLFNVYGNNGGGLVDKILRHEHIKVNGNGYQRRDYVHVADVVDAFVAALNCDWRGTVDVGTGKSRSVNEVLEMFEHTDYEHVYRNGGVIDSTASKNYLFPWKPLVKLEDYAGTSVV